MVSRRSMLVAPALGLAAAAVAPVAAYADDAEGLAVPETLARELTLTGPGIAPDTEFPLTHLGLSWDGAGEVGVRPLTPDGWGDWRDAAGCPGGTDGGPTASGGLLAVPGAVGYELAVRGEVGAIRAVELNTVDGPVSHVAPPHNKFLRLGGKLTPVRYYSRAAWGANEAWRFNPDGTEKWPPAYYPVQTLTVHYAFTRNDDPDPAATVRSMYYDHNILRGNGDFNYHLVVDEQGAVYEGRHSGADGFPVFGPQLGPDGRPMMVNAAHIGGWNAGNIGVCLLGDFTTRQPTPAAYASLRKVLWLLAKVLDLDVEAVTNYVNPVSGARKTVLTLSAHRDWAPTDCPGHAFYPRMAQLRADVARHP